MKNHFNILQVLSIRSSLVFAVLFILPFHDLSSYFFVFFLVCWQFPPTTNSILIYFVTQLLNFMDKDFEIIVIIQKWKKLQVLNLTRHVMIRILWSLKLTVLTEAAEAWDARDGDPRLDLAVGARETAGLASPRFIDASLSQRSSSSRTSFSIWSRFKSLSPCSPRPFCWRKEKRHLRRERTVPETTLYLYLIWFQVRIGKNKVYLNMKTQLFFCLKFLHVLTHISNGVE